MPVAEQSRHSARGAPECPSYLAKAPLAIAAVIEVALPWLDRQLMCVVKATPPRCLLDDVLSH